MSKTTKTTRRYFVSFKYTHEIIHASWTKIHNNMLKFYDEKDNLIKEFEINEALHFDDLQ